MSASDDHERREGLLTRWSRRKREEAKQALPVVPEREEPASPETEAEEAFDLSLLPDLEAITADTDLSLFFRKGVPEALKNAALRKMWSADIAIRDHIGPVDFQWDFNAPDGVPGFGPLEADFDLDSMLRQAIGERPLEESAIAQALPAEPRPTLPEPSDEQSAVEPPAGEAQVLVSQISSSADANSGISVESGMELPVFTRRHGGALPRGA